MNEILCTSDLVEFLKQSTKSRNILMPADNFCDQQRVTLETIEYIDPSTLIDLLENNIAPFGLNFE